MHVILNSVDDLWMTSRELETPFRTGAYEKYAVHIHFSFANCRRTLDSRECGCFRRNLKGMISWFIYLFLSFLISYFCKLHYKLIQITNYAYYLEHSYQWWSTLFGSFNQKKSMKISYTIYPIYYFEILLWASSFPSSSMLFFWVD